MTWTTDGKGGDGKGRLLSGPTRFDNGRCVEDNGSEISKARIAAGGGGPCFTGFSIPQDVKSDLYTVYWV